MEKLKLAINFVIVSGISLMLVACSVNSELPNSVQNVRIPEHWQATSRLTAEQPSSWLKTFNDEYIEQLVMEALHHNYDLQVVAERVQMATARAQIAGAELLPEVNVQLDTQRQRRNAVTSGQNNKIYSTQYAVTFGVQWEADVWGRIRAGRDAAGQELIASEADFSFARLSLAARTTQAWFDLITAHQQVNIAEQSATGRKRVAKLVQNRYNRGLSTSLELRQILTDLAGNEALVARRHNEFENTRRQFEVLLGRYPAATVETAKTLPALFAPPLVGLPSQLLARRPDLIAGHARLKGAGLRVAETEAALLPAFTLTTNGGASSQELNNLFDPGSLIWTFTNGLLQL